MRTKNRDQKKKINYVYKDKIDKLYVISLFLFLSQDNEDREYGLLKERYERMSADKC